MTPSGSIRWFADIGLADRGIVGGKGGSLGELTRLGVEVPPGFVVTTSAFNEFIGVLERDAPLRSEAATLPPGDLAAVTECSRRLRARIESAPLPSSLRAQITDAYATLPGDVAGEPGAVAVRSSATLEDAADASFAGLQDTFLWVTDAEQMLTRVRACWGSLYSTESLVYRRQRGFAESGVAMAVVVQRMIDARAAGVLFTRSPTSGDSSVITIEGAWGLGSSVVGGEVTPDRWVIGKVTGEISVRDISDKRIEHRARPGGGVESAAVPDDRRRAACLADSELSRLREIARRVERHYGHAQDIEWAIDHAGATYLLQSRPETVWSARDAQPAARSVDNPLLHVMTIFGGRR